MDRVGIDMCHWMGQDYLVMVNLYSFYIWVERLKKKDSEKVISIVKSWWNQGLGVPLTLCSDNGPPVLSSIHKLP